MTVTTDPIKTGVTPFTGAQYLRALAGVSGVTLNNANISAYRKAFAKALSGGRGRIVLMGDSTTAGAGSGTNSGGTSGMVGARAKNWPTRLASALTSEGIPTWNESVWGDQNASGAGEAYNAYDPRVNPGSWTTQFINTLGGKAWTTSTNGATFAFTPNMTFDRFDVYTVQNSGLGTVTVNVDGGATLATIAEAGAASVIKTTVTCARGTHTINIVTSSATQTYLLGVVPWDSTLGGVDIIQCGHWGGTLANLANTANPWEASHATLLSAIAADVAALQMTINDSNSGTSAATYASQLATIEAAWATSGAEVLLMSGLISNNAASTNGQLDSLVTELKNRASSRSRVFADLGARCGSYAAMNTLGFMFSDGTHGNALMYADEGLWMAQVLLSQVR